MKKRLHEIDGIRGWAALVVLIFHLTWEIFGVNFPLYRTYYFKFLLDGPLAVYIFFVLSGDALSNGYMRLKDENYLAKLAIKRYFRLAGPILLSCLIVYILMKAHLTFNHQASKFVNRDDWLGAALPFRESFQDLLSYALLNVFTKHSIDNSYNPFLWPMSIELYGSFFIFSILFSLKFLKRPLIITSMAAFYLWVLGSFYSLFFIGLTFSILRQKGFFQKLKNHGKPSLFMAIIFALAILDSLLEKHSFRLPQASIFLAGAFVFTVHSSYPLTNFFSNSISRYLGKISFPLYLSHFAVIVSYTSWIIDYYGAIGALDFIHSGAIIISSTFISILIADIFPD